MDADRMNRKQYEVESIVQFLLLHGKLKQKTKWETDNVCTTEWFVDAFQ